MSNEFWVSLALLALFFLSLYFFYFGLKMTGLLPSKQRGNEE